MFSLFFTKAFRYGRVLPRPARRIHTEQTESTRPGNPQETKSSTLGNSQDAFTQINAFRSEFTDFRVEIIEKVSSLREKGTDLEAKMKVLPFQTGSIAAGMIAGTATILGAFGWNVEFKLKKKK